MKPSMVAYCCALALVGIGGVLEYRENQAARLKDREVWTDADDTAMGTLHDAYSQRARDVPASETATGDGMAQTDVTDNADN